MSRPSICASYLISTGRQHPGLHLQIIVLALTSHFFLMRFEIAYALLDFVALRHWPDCWRDGPMRCDRFRRIGKRLLSYPQRNWQIWNGWALLDLICKGHRALDQCVEVLLPVHHGPALHP